MNGILAIELDSDFVPIQAELERVEKCICERLRFSEVPIEPYLEYLTDKTGRMIRPAVLLLAAKASAGFRDEHIQAAAVIEMIHRAAKLHDWVDSSGSWQIGPGQKMLHKKTAYILLGDFFLSQAFILQSHMQIPRLGEILSQTSLSLITGQLQLQLLPNGPDIEPDDYIRMIEAKTAFLFQTGCQLGAMIAAASEDQIEALSQYGSQLGMAYQLADDLLTVLNAQEEADGAATAEILMRKPNFPVIHFLSENRNDKTEPQMPLQLFISKLHKFGSIDHTCQRVRTHIGEAKQSLHILAPGDYTQALCSLADRIGSSISSAESVA